MVGREESRIKSVGEQDFSFSSGQHLGHERAIVNISADPYGIQERFSAGKEQRADVTEFFLVWLQLGDWLGCAAGGGQTHNGKSEAGRKVDVLILSPNAAELIVNRIYKRSRDTAAKSGLL